jgi:phosphoserine phosphatase
VIPPIINATAKADHLAEIARTLKIPLEETVAVGDGANDLLMMERSGFGVAFNAKPAVKARANASINQESLLPLLSVLGLA